MRRWALIAFLLPVGIVAGASGTRARTAVARPPLIGANYTHYASSNCSLADGIVAHYDRRGVRRLVRAQLAAMRAARIQSLRLLLWHMSDATGQNWGIVPSGGGRLAEPYRSNLVRYLSDVRQAGIRRLTLAFGPTWTNDPLGTNYDPAMFDEDWSFVRDVRPLLKRYGPSSTHVDLMSEGAPPAWLAPAALTQDEDYIARLWSNYVDAFGGADASFSSVGADGPYDTTERLQNLIDALRASGRPLPRWFDVHPAYDEGETLSVLRAVDALLTKDGLSQPLVIGEEAYNDAPVARAIATFVAASSRPVLEVMEWPLRADRACKDMSVSPPYRADAYLTALTGRPAPPPTPDPPPLPPIPTLYATVGPGRTLSLRTAPGRAVVSLDAGQYRLVVRDRSAMDNFELVGPDIDRMTGLRFRGTVVWKIDIGREVRYGAAYTYLSDRKSSGLAASFVIH